MKKVAIEQARARLERAKVAAALLDEDIPIADKRAAWSDFLAQANTVVLKLEVGALGHGKSEAWFRRLARARRLDPLLAYAQQARHADEHTLGDGPAALGRMNAVVHPSGFFFGTEIPDGAEPAGFQSIRAFDVASGRWLPDAGGMKAQLLTSSIWLKPVVVRGREYPVPTKHLGNEIGASPQVVAALTIAYFEKVLDDAEKLDPHN